MWNNPGRRWEKQLDDLMAMSDLGDWDSGYRPAGVLSHKQKSFRNHIYIYIYIYIYIRGNKYKTSP